MRHLFFLFLLVCSIVRAQNEDVEIRTHETESGLALYALNKTAVQHEITLNLSVKNLSGYQGPITKMVKAKDSIQMIQLSFQEGMPWSYETNYTYTPTPTEEEQVQQKEQVKKELFGFLDTKNNPIIVFYGEGCTRSAYAKEMLEKKKLAFKYLNVTTNDHYNKIMQELVLLKDPDITTIGYPVFLVNGEIDYSIENLRWYIKELASNME
ncbi:hypothetical protein [Flagellimonas sp.]|uniref:hypothetical protein n=1 Tax=Flagellimonas sp. TaxID=2058762 RepID=UPI003B50BE49